ncbi:MAG: hypothetical protein Fur0019_08160 [Tibeticola sp.]
MASPQTADGRMPGADLAEALLDFQTRPGRYSVAMREPHLLFERMTDVLALAIGRQVEGLGSEPEHLDALREAARFFVRTALLRPGADHFSLLGLTPDFDAATLREHYRMLIRMTHPDFAGVGGAPWPADAATRINLANDVLSSDERREAYAQSLQRPRPAGGPAPASARWAKDPWHADTSSKRWPAVAAGLGVVTLLGFWLWPSQTPQERLARLAAEAQEQELAAQQAAKETQAAQVAAAARAAAPTPSAPTQTPPAAPAQTSPTVRTAAATSPTAPPRNPSPIAQTTPAAPPSTLAQSRPAPVPSPVPATSPVTAAPAAVALAADGGTPKLSPVINPPPERVAATRPSPVAQPASALEPSARTMATPAQAVTPQRAVAAPMPAPAQAVAPSPAVVVAAPPAAPPPAPAAAPAVPAQGIGSAVPAPTPTLAAALPPVTTASPAQVAAVTAQPAPAPAPAAERVVAAQPAPVPSPARNAGNSLRMSEVQPLLNQLLGALQSGRGDAAVRLIDTMARQSGAGAGFSEAYERTLGGGRLLRIGQVQFAGRPTGDQLVVDGVLQLQVQENGQETASREFVMRAAFVSRGGQPVLTQLSPAGTGR